MLSAESNAEADNTYRGLDNLGYPKKESNNCFIIRCFDENKDTKTHRKTNIGYLPLSRWKKIILKTVRFQSLNFSQRDICCKQQNHCGKS